MSLRIVWSPASKDEYAELLSFVELNHGLEAALRLLEKTEKLIESISANPEMFPASGPINLFAKPYCPNRHRCSTASPLKKSNYFIFGTTVETRIAYSLFSDPL
jgi:hypothetical protein